MLYKSKINVLKQISTQKMWVWGEFQHWKPNLLHRKWEKRGNPAAQSCLVSVTHVKENLWQPAATSFRHMMAKPWFVIKSYPKCLSLPPSLTQQSPSVQLHQGRLLWATLFSGSVINNCLQSNLLPSLLFHWLLNTALLPQDGDSIKQINPLRTAWQLLCLGDTKPVTSSAEGQRVCEGQMSWDALHHSPLIW